MFERTYEEVSVVTIYYVTTNRMALGSLQESILKSMVKQEINQCLHPRPLISFAVSQTSMEYKEWYIVIDILMDSSVSVVWSFWVYLDSLTPPRLKSYPRLNPMVYNLQSLLITRRGGK